MGNKVEKVAEKIIEREDQFIKKSNERDAKLNEKVMGKKVDY